MAVLDTTSGFELSSLSRQLSLPQGFGDQSLLSSHPGAVRLLGGIPDGSVLPAEELRDAVHDVWERGEALGSLQYSSSQGFPGLRSWIAAREGVDPRRVVVTNGGMHGLSLAIQTFVERGSLVAVDNPVFPLFLRALELSTTATLPVPVASDGLDVEHLAHRLAHGARISAVYTVPDFHNPTQGTLSDEKRHALVALAERYGFVVVADDPYRELRFAGRPQDVSVLHDSDHVVHVNTFTKTLGPGLRLGWLVLPEPHVDAVVRLRNRQDSHSSTFVQTLVEHLLTSRDGWFDERLTTARRLYGHRARLLADLLRAELGGALEVTDAEGGFFLWPRVLDDTVDTAELHRRAVALGLEYQPGEFFASGPGTDAARHLRLAYGDRTDDELRTAVARLGEALSRTRLGNASP